jgi:chemotaxis protein MotA
LLVSEAAAPFPLRGEVNQTTKRLDLSLCAGIAVAFCAMVAGVVWAKLDLRYFLHPTGAAIVLGGTLGVTLITTPGPALLNSIRRIFGLLSATPVNRDSLIEEIVEYMRLTRREGLPALERAAAENSNTFLRNALLMAADVTDRGELKNSLELEVRLRERQGNADAKALEVAGGFAPTIGILGTVIGLIEVMKQFSNLQSVGYGIGTAFVSTIYGLALANLFLLPLAHRIRARVAETFETQELIVEGVLAVADRVHPSLARIRLRSFLREVGQ